MNFLETIIDNPHNLRNILAKDIDLQKEISKLYSETRNNILEKLLL